MRLIKGDSRYLGESAESLLDSDLGKFYFPSRQKAEDAIKEFIPSGCFLVALDGEEKPLGFICYLPTGAFHAFPLMHLIVTSRGNRGKGIGSKMMDLFERDIFNHASKLFLVVSDFNPGAMKFYMNRDYRKIGIIPSLYRSGIDEHLMMKVK